MKRLLSRIKKDEKILVIVLVAILLAFSYGPLVKIYLTPLPNDQVFLGSYGYPPDFWGNMLSVNEGRLGNWLYFPRHSSTISAPGTLPKMEYRLLGQINRLVPINQIVFFHLSRFFLSIIFLIISYKLISLVIKNKTTRLVALVLALFSTGVTLGSNLFFEFWTPIGVFQRSNYYHHYLIAFIFILVILIILSQALTEKNLKKLAIASLLGFLASFVHAPNTVSLFLVLLFYLVILFIKNSKEKLPLKSWGYKIVYTAVFGLVSAIPLIYLFKIGHSYPWNLFNANEQKFNISLTISLSDFVFGIGPSLLLGLIGSYFILKKKDDLSLMLAPWAWVYIVGYLFLWRLFNFNSQRFIQTPFFIILGILSALTLEKLVVFLRSRVKLLKIKLSSEILIAILALLVLSASIPSMRYSYEINKQNFSWAGDYLYYSTRDILDAVSWLSKNTQRNDIVLAHVVNAELVSALAGNLVYANIHANELSNYEELERSIMKFYVADQSVEECIKFLTENKIKYVFWSYKERGITPLPRLDFPFLKVAYQNPTVTVFEYDLVR